MSAPQRAPEPEAPPPSTMPGHDDVEGDLTMAELVQRARERAEAEADVGAVMRRKHEQAAKREALEHRKHHAPPIKGLLLLARVCFNLYIWLGNPGWLTYNQPSGLSIDYSQSSWEVAVYLQRQRIEEYRQAKGHIPATAQQAGPTVHGVHYTPIEQKNYELDWEHYLVSDTSWSGATSGQVLALTVVTTDSLVGLQIVHTLGSNCAHGSVGNAHAFVVFSTLESVR